MRENHKLLAGSGWKRVDDTSAHTNAHYGIQVREDTVIATWTAKGGTVNLLTKFNLATKTITTSDPAIIIPDAWVKGGAQTITLTSGSINLLLV